MTELSIKNLIKEIEELDISRTDRYIITYEAYVNNFSELEFFQPSDILKCVGFAYSWMPRILSINPSQLGAFQKLLNALKEGPDEEIIHDAFETARNVVSGSIIAASKVMHFLFPEIYPIYDSHIYRYCWSNIKCHYYLINNIDKYWQYFQALTTLVSDTEVLGLQCSVQSALGYPVSKIRALEFAMFHSSKSKFQPIYESSR